MIICIQLTLEQYRCQGHHLLFDSQKPGCNLIVLCICTPVFNCKPCSTIVHSYVLSRLTLHNPMDCSPPGSSVHGIFQARILEWVVISSSRGIFPTQGSNPSLLRQQADSLLLCHQGTLSINTYLAGEKKSMYKQTHAVQTCVIQGLIVYYKIIGYFF